MVSSCRVSARVLWLTFVLGAIAACAPDDGADPPAVGADDQALLNASNAFVPTWETTPPTKGTISSGTYAATQADDATFEQLSEAKSGSKQLLDHTWKITDVTGAGAFSLSVIATKGQSGGDAFNLTWATATGTGATATCGTFQPFSPACSITAVTPAETACATTITNPTSVICVKVVDSITGSDATANTVRVDAIALREATAPAAIANLAAGTATASTIPLTWTAPGDDGATGTATSNDVRYATAAITEATWAAATPATGEPAPGVAGTAQSFTLTGLASATTYYVAVKTTDESGNVAALSNVASATTTALPDLQVTAFTGPATAGPQQLVSLSWTVRNGGAATASGSYSGGCCGDYRWYDGVYLSTDAVLDAADVYVGNWATANAFTLAAAATYTTTTTFQLPAVAAGNYNLILKSDYSGNRVAEGDEANNTRALPIEIGTADLAVTSFTGPATAGPQQLVSLSWTVRNGGTATATGSYSGGCCGDYRWYDGVYLSTDATWDAADTYVGNVATANQYALAAGASYTATNTFQLPAAAAGSYYLVVKSDYTGRAYEANETNNNAATPISIGTADLSVTSFTAPGSAGPQQLVSLSWTVRNGGTAAATGSYSGGCCGDYRWYDGVYLSTDATWDAADTYISNVATANLYSLAGGASYTATTTMQLPAVAAGNYYLVLRADYTGRAFETDETNNAAATPIAIGTADLSVTSFTAPGSAGPQQLVSLSWTVRNDGTAAATGVYSGGCCGDYRWYDGVYLSTDPTWDAADTYVNNVATANQYSLAGGASYTATTTMQLPAAVAGNYYLILRADYTGRAYEANEANNAYAVPIAIGTADLAVTAFTAPSSAGPQALVSLSWTVGNLGTAAATGAYSGGCCGDFRWYDGVYLSTDATWDAADTYISNLATANQYSLGSGGSYPATGTFQMPAVADGNYYLIVKADYSGRVFEADETNNTAAMPIAIGTADLAVTTFTAPAAAGPQALVSLSWSVRNGGSAAATGSYSGGCCGDYRWYDGVYLSTDAALDGADTFVGNWGTANQYNLAAGASYTTTTTMQLPAVAAGSYYLILKTDYSGNRAYEADENNNTYAVPLTIGTADLQVATATAPATAGPQALVTVAWTMRNNGTAAATGAYSGGCCGDYRWYDGVYLSTDATWDAADTYINNLATANQYNLAAGATYAASGTFQLPAVTDGNYYLIVKADYSGRVFEADETNNSYAVPIAIGTADLSVTSFTAPGSAGPQALVSLSWTVQNGGTAAATGSYSGGCCGDYRWYDGVYLSTDAALDGADTYVSNVGTANQYNLAAGASYTTTTTMQLPAVAAGSYYLIVKADYSGNRAYESNETNNTYAVPLTIGTADLAVTSFVAPATAGPQALVSLTWTVQNGGTAAATGSYSGGCCGDYRWYDGVYLSTDGVLDAGDTFVSNWGTANQYNLAAGASYTTTTTMQLPAVAAGNYQLIVATDYSGARVYESSDANNTYAVPIAIGTADLTVTSFAAPSSAGPQQLVSLSWTVRNGGTAAATGAYSGGCCGDFRWYDGVYLSTDTALDAGDVYVGNVATANAYALAGGASYTATATMQLPAVVAGSYHLIVKADYSGNRAYELDDANNTFSAPILIGTADLAVASFTAPVAAGPQALVSLTWTVQNGGTAAATGAYSGGCCGDYRWYDGVYLSTDATLDAADTFVGNWSTANQYALAAGTSYTTTTTMQLPAAAEGSYYLLLKTDYTGNRTFEANEGNNVAAAPISIGTADLRVTSATAPASAGPLALVNLAWTVQNGGTAAATGSYSGGCCGDFRWYDGVYLSTDGTLDGADLYVGNIARANQSNLAAGGSYTASGTFQLPAVAAGAYQLIIVADYTGNRVFETSEVNNTYAVPLTIGTADLAVATFTAPASAGPQALVSLTWTVANGGTTAATGSYSGGCCGDYRWYDGVYLSTDAALDGADTFVGNWSTANQYALAAGASYTTTTTMQLPAVAAGSYYLILKTDYSGNRAYETSEANNTYAVPLTIGTADLTVASFTAPTSAGPQQLVNLTWTVQNGGTAAATGSYSGGCCGDFRWYDGVYLSADATLDGADTFVGNWATANQYNLAAGASYTAATTMQLPAVAAGSYYLILKTDYSGNRAYETSETNNTYAVPLTIGSAELAVTSFTAPATAGPQELVSLTWTVRNSGTAAATGSYSGGCCGDYRWGDAVYLSTDGTLDAGDTYVGSWNTANQYALAANATYTTTATMPLPAVAAGNYQLIVKTDSGARVYETSEANNTFAVPIAIGTTDLVVTALTGPASAGAQALVSLSWTVRNTGTATATGSYSGGCCGDYRWGDAVYLSIDGTLDAADPLIGTWTAANLATVAAGATYTTTVTMQLPGVAAGSYQLLVKTDHGGRVYETNDGNNVSAAVPITIGTADLVATALTGPAQALPQQAINLTWTVANQGAMAATGAYGGGCCGSYQWFDGVYLSSDTVVDAGDVFVGDLGTANQYVLAAGASYTATKTFALPQSAGGRYYLIVKADHSGRAFESNETNNTFATPIDVLPVDGPAVSLGDADWSVVASPSFAPDSGRLVATDGAVARVWELASFTEQAGYAGHTANLDAASFGPTGAQVLTSGKDGTAQLWDALTLAQVRSFAGSTATNPSAISRDGALVAVGNGASPKIYQVATGALVATLTGHTAAVTSLAFSADGTRVVTGSLDDTARIWNAATGALVATLAHGVDVNDVAVAAVGDRFATAGADGKARLWVLSTGASAGQLDQGYPVGSVDYSADGAYLVTGDAGVSATRAAQAYLWNVATGARLRGFNAPHETACPSGVTCTPHNMNAGSITGLAFAPDRTMIAMTQGNGRVRLFATALSPIVATSTVDLVVGQPAPARLTPNHTLTFRFPTAEMGNYVVRYAATATGATYAATGGSDPLAATMRLAAGQPPTATAYDDQADAHASFLSTGVPVSLAVAGYSYVTISAPLLTGGALDGTITVEAAPTIAVASAWPRRVGNTGHATIAVRGTQLDKSTTFALTASGAAVARVIQGSVDRAAVTFALAGVAPGVYGLTATDTATNTTVTLAQAVQVVAGTGPSLSYAIEGSTLLRSGTTRSYTVRWRNDGDADAVAPLLKLTAPTGGAIVGDGLAEAPARLLFAGVAGYPADVVPPGASGSFTTLVRMPPPGVASGTLGLSAAPADDPTPFPWSGLRGTIPTEQVTGPEWEAMWSAATGSIGGTWNDVVASSREVLPYFDGAVAFGDLLPYLLAFHAELATAETPLLASTLEPTTAATAFDAEAGAALTAARPRATRVDGRLGLNFSLYTYDLSGLTSVGLMQWVNGGLSSSVTINPAWPTVNIIHGSFTGPSGAGGAYADLANQIVQSYGGNVNVVFSNWQSVATQTTGLADALGWGGDSAANKFLGGFTNASNAADVAGRRIASQLEAAGVGDVIHIAHSHGRFVANAIAQAMRGVSHGIIETSPGAPLGNLFGPRMNYGAFDGGSLRMPNLASLIDDHTLHFNNGLDGIVRRAEGLASSYPGNWISNLHAGGVRSLSNWLRDAPGLTPRGLLDRARAGEFGRPLPGWLRGLGGALLYSAATAAICALSPYPTACNYAFAAVESILCACPWPLLLQLAFDLIWPVDPEELVGPGPDGATVSRASPWSYDVNIWNHASATAPVQEVVAVTYLDPELDPSTLEFGAIQYGEQIVDVPDGATTWTLRDVPINDGCTVAGTTSGDLAVDLSVSFDPVTGRVAWRLAAVDTATGLPPDDPMAGLLPPPDDQLCGRAHLTYAIRPRATTANGTAIGASVTVTFDGFDPSETNLLTNLVGP
jgi:subtilase family serine protease